MPRNQKPQEHPQQSKRLRLLKRRAPLLLRKTKGLALSDCTDAEIIAEYVRRGLGFAFDRKTYQRTYMRDYIAQAPDDNLEPGIAVGARDLPTARGP
jgi:hypothetical protein